MSRTTHDPPILAVLTEPDQAPNGEQQRTRTDDVKAPIEAVRPSDAPGPQPAGGSPGDDAVVQSTGQLSTMSTNTRLPYWTAAVLTTVRKAVAVRPPRPITLP